MGLPRPAHNRIARSPARRPAPAAGNLSLARLRTRPQAAHPPQARSLAALPPGRNRPAPGPPPGPPTGARPPGACRTLARSPCARARPPTALRLRQTEVCLRKTPPRCAAGLESEEEVH